MKKIYSSLMMIAVALFTAFTFSSCDDDVEEAMILSGEWTGDFGMYYEYRNPYTGQWMDFDADYTNLVFYPAYEYATHGTGQQVDYYHRGPYAYQYYFFEWKIRNGRIYMYYPDAPELNVAITNYRMSDYSFSGVVGNTRFSLRKLYDFYRWGEYVGDYGYGWNDSWYWDDYYYGKGREGGKSVGGVDENAEVRRGNRFADEAKE